MMNLFFILVALACDETYYSNQEGMPHTLLMLEGLLMFLLEGMLMSLLEGLLMFLLEGLLMFLLEGLLMFLLDSRR